jgi:hypothetical protein
MSRIFAGKRLVTRDGRSVERITLSREIGCLMRKYKRLTTRRTKAFRELTRLASASPGMFVHWEAGVIL